MRVARASAALRAGNPAFCEFPNYPPEIGEYIPEATRK